MSWNRKHEQNKNMKTEKAQKRSKDKDQREQMNVGGRQVFNLIFYISESVALNT